MLQQPQALQQLEILSAGSPDRCLAEMLLRRRETVMETVTEEMKTEERETKQSSSLTFPMSEAEYKFVCVFVW